MGNQTTGKKTTSKNHHHNQMILSLISKMPYPTFKENEELQKLFTNLDTSSQKYITDHFDMSMVNMTSLEEYMDANLTPCAEHEYDMCRLFLETFSNVSTHRPDVIWHTMKWIKDENTTLKEYGGLLVKNNALLIALHDMIETEKVRIQML